MNKILVVILVLAIVVLVSGCTQVKDCGNDTECFLEAAKNCTPAKLTSSIEIGEEDNRILMSMVNQIGGMQDTDCVFYMKIDDLTIPQTMLSKFPDLVQDFNALKGTSMTCRIPRDLEIKTFDELKAQIMNTQNERCEGTYKTLLELSYQKVKDKMEEVYSEGIHLIATDCDLTGNATIRIRNVGTEDITSSSTTITRTKPTTADINTMSPSIIASSEAGIIYDEDCGSGNMCKYTVILQGGRSSEFYVLC